MVHILIQDLLFGVSDTELEPLKKPEDIVEKPHEQVVGRCRDSILSSLTMAYIAM
jgi:hypothetical protein